MTDWNESALFAASSFIDIYYKEDQVLVWCSVKAG